MAGSGSFVKHGGLWGTGTSAGELGEDG